MSNWSSDPDEGRMRGARLTATGRTASELEAERESAVTVDVAEALSGRQIACQWAQVGVTSEWRVWARNTGASRRRHNWHKIGVQYGRLVCDCEGYTYSKERPKQCTHLWGTDGLDGAAAWIEREAYRAGLLAGQVAFCQASHDDPLRQAVRRLMRARAIAEAEERRGGPLTLEDLFDFS